MNNKPSIAQLQALIHQLSWNDGFGCHTRGGFEKVVWPEIAHKAKWIVYFDIDGMHELNEFYGGYQHVDFMIRQVLASVRSTDFVAGQWKSGDEFLVCLTESDQRAEMDPQGLVKRLIEALAMHEMTATFAIVPVLSMDLAENVQPAVDKVYARKNQRGTSR